MHEDENNPRSTPEGTKPVKGKIKKQCCVFEIYFGLATAFLL